MPDDRVRALAQEYWDTYLSANPTTATFLGEHRYDDRIEDLSAEGEQALRPRWASLLARVDEADHAAAGLSLDDRVTCSQLRVEIGDFLAAIDHRLGELRSDHVTGYHMDLLTLAPLISASGPDSADALVGRLHLVPQALEQTGERFLAGLAAGRTPVRICVERSLNVIAGYLDSPLDTDVFAAIGAPSGRDDWPGEPAWREALRAAVREHVRPAYRRLGELLTERLLPVARDDNRPGLCWLDGGDELYATLMRQHTSLDVDAASVHRFGLEEADARLPEQWAAVGGRLFDLRDPSALFTRLRADQSLRFARGDEVLAAAEELLAAANAQAPRWFGRLPQTPCDIAPIPDLLAAEWAFAYYMPPPTDGSRPGTYYVNTANPGDKARFDSAVIAFHEAVPGHHFQLAIAAELTELPAFRRFSQFNAAFCEGWGLYAERLAEEMGLYRDDLDRVGMLSADSLRSCRLVVDTGMHALGWSRTKAIEFMAAHTPMSPDDVAAEIDRYIAMPGQALAYKIGQREIFQLRAAAQAGLGPAFDIKAFHDAVLGSGSVALPTLRTVIAEWMHGATTGAAHGGTTGAAAGPGA